MNATADMKERKPGARVSNVSVSGPRRTSALLQSAKVLHEPVCSTVALLASLLFNPLGSTGKRRGQVIAENHDSCRFGEQAVIVENRV